MLISSYERGDTPEFTLVRNGNEVTATFFYLLNGLDFSDPWSGGMYAEIGTYEGSIDQEGEREMNLEIITTLAEDTTTSGIYYIQDHADDVVLERQFTVTLFSAAGNFLATANADYVFGSADDDTFRSSGTFDSFDLGPDAFEGGAGNDLYRIYSADTKVFETAGGGTDRIAAGVSYVLAAGVAVEQLTTNGAAGTSSINLTGNSLAQTIYGNAGDNILRDGGGAGDVLIGLGGNDTYLIYSAATTIQESAGQGTADRVGTAVSYSLGAGVDVEILSTTSSAGTAAINLTGNALSQTITGNAADNLLHDGGKGGPDVLRGLAGNDMYRVFNGGDVIVEGVGQGAADRVVAAVDFVLSAGAQVEFMQTNSSTSTAAIDLTGNEFGQTIVGNYGQNRLDGKGGNDILQGLPGKDVFVFSSALGPDNVDRIVGIDSDDRFELENSIFVGLRGGTLTYNAFRANSTGLAEDADDRIILRGGGFGGIYFDPDGVGGVASVQFAVITSPGVPLDWAHFHIV